jgi:hypothetical protein
LLWKDANITRYLFHSERQVRTYQTRIVFFTQQPQTVALQVRSARPRLESIGEDEYKSDTMDMDGMHTQDSDATMDEEHDSGSYTTRVETDHCAVRVGAFVYKLTSRN